MATSLCSLRIVVAAAMICTTIATGSLAGDRPQWGQRFSRNMVSDETGLPESFDPTTGENIKWSASLGTESYSTPVVSGGRVIIGANNGEPRDPRHDGDRGVLLCLDEADGSLCWQLVVPKFQGDIYLDWPRAGICSPATVEGQRVYAVTTTAELWSFPMDDHCCSSPAIHDGLAFVADCGRNVHCLDARTGRPYWTHKTDGEIWGSTLVADGKVYIGTRREDFWILAADRRKKVIARIEFDAPICSSPVVANGTLYVATLQRLGAIRKASRR